MLSIGQINYMKFSFHPYASEVLNLVADEFSPAYRHVFSPYWNNSFEARARRNYARAYWEDGIYEVYFPVMAHQEMNMRYYRVVVKVVPEISQGEAKELAIDLMKPRQKPNGIIESESIFIVAPKRKGWTHGFRHVRLPGHQTCIIVDRNPLRAFQTLKKLIAKFVESKLKGILRKFGLQPDCSLNEIWYKKKGSFYYCIFYNNKRTRFKLYYHIRQTIRCLSRFLDWLKQRAKRLKVVERMLDELVKVRGLSGKREVLTELWRRTVRKHNEYHVGKALKLLARLAER